MENKSHIKFPPPKGFTLIELLIVIVIIGVLLGTLLPRLVGARERATDLSVQAGMAQITQGLEAYFNDNGSYPGTPGTPECLSPGETVHDLLEGDYLSDVPTGIEGSNIDFGGIAAGAAGIAKIIFYIFIVLFLISLVMRLLK